MSATSYNHEDCLRARSQFTKPGVKKLVKARLSRTQRVQAKLQLAGEVQALKPTTESRRQLQDLRDLTPAELEDYADHLLQDSRPEEERFDEVAQDFGDVPLDFFREESTRVPSHLLGALPDWIIFQLDDANGDAFAVLSLFEAKSPSPKAAISLDDEAMYA